MPGDCGDTGHGAERSGKPGPGRPAVRVASATAGGSIAATVLVLGAAARFGAALPPAVAVVALVLTFLLAIAHLGRGYRQDGQRHREVMREHDVRELRARCRTVVDTADRPWTPGELRLLLAAEHERDSAGGSWVPRPRGAAHDSIAAARHRAG